MTAENRYRVELAVAPGDSSQPLEAADVNPVNIVILGDFQGVGAHGREAAEVGIGPLLPIDGDRLDRVLARLAPRLQLSLHEGEQLDLTFAQLEDFHPDRLLERVPLFETLRSVRERARASGESSDALRKAAGLPSRSAPAAPSPTPAKPSAPLRPPPSGSVLDWILEEAPSKPAAPSELDEFVAGAVAGHLVAEPDAGHASLLSDLDTALAAKMRQLLHSRPFQALEAVWRGTALLLHRLETGPALKVHLVQATPEALLADARASDPRRSALRRTLQSLPQSSGLTILVVDVAFDAKDEDLEVLASLGRSADSIGGVVLAGAAPGLVGLREGVPPDGPWDLEPWTDPAWLAFRASSEANSVGLALPRVLLRSPYGEDGESVEAFEFEEVLGTPPQPDQFLWGNPAFACALVLGEALGADGSASSLGDRLEVMNLPVHSWRLEDESGLIACTEWSARTDIAAALLKAGLMVFVPGGQGDSARLLRFQTVENR